MIDATLSGPALSRVTAAVQNGLEFANTLGFFYL